MLKAHCQPQLSRFGTLLALGIIPSIPTLASVTPVTPVDPHAHANAAAAITTNPTPPGPAPKTNTLGAPAGAVANLLRVQITDGHQVDLFFDTKVLPKQIRTEFFNDIIQLSLQDVSVYPAKINSVSGAQLTKVFAYQYAPRLVRVRFTVKGKAESYQDKVNVRAGGRVLTLKMAPTALARNSAKVAPRDAAAETSKERLAGANKGANEEISSKDSAPARAPLSPEEKSLLDRVVKSAAVVESPETASEKSAGIHAKAGAPERKDEQKESKLGGAKPLPSPLRSLGYLLAIVGFLGMVAAVVRKKRGGGALKAKGNEKGILKFIETLTGGNSQGIIQVLANQSLGPKQSLSVVRVGNRQLVLGVSADSIRLITDMPYSGPTVSGMDADLESLSLESDLTPEAPLQRPTGASAAGPSLFAEALKKAGAPIARTPAPTYPSQPRTKAPVVAPALNSGESVRNRIRSRLEGLKQL